MSDLKTTIPGAIVILSGGTKKCVNKSGAISYASTTYEDGDAFGLLGGYARVEAGAILARKFPKAFVITTSCRGLNEPTHASIMAEELKKLGVFASRIVLEEKSTNTLSQIIETLDIVFQRRWENIFFITNKYHVPRVRALYGYVMDNTLDNKKNKKKYVVNFISAESILSDFDKNFILYFEKVKKTTAYKKRLESEKRGVKMILDGVYKPIREFSLDKKEKHIE